MKPDANTRFNEFRNSLISDLYAHVIERGGEIKFKGKTIDLKFSGLKYYEDVLGSVTPISLTATPHTPDTVTFAYRLPEWCEDNANYVEYESSSEVVKATLETFSADELFNIINAID